jgi:hypothetical protein
VRTWLEGWRYEQPGGGQYGGYERHESARSVQLSTSATVGAAIAALGGVVGGYVSAIQDRIEQRHAGQEQSADERAAVADRR